MKRTCFVHIGMHKTGSSSIQASLTGMDDLGSHCYADICGVVNHGGAMINIFSRQPEKVHVNVKRGLTSAQMQERRDKFQAGLAHAVASHPEKDLVISGEGICYLAEEELLDFRNFLAESFTDIRVLGYVRSPKSFMESAFQQRVKGGTARLEPGLFYPRYRDLFEKFDRVFGRDKVLLRKFDPATFPQGCVVQDFCRLIGIPILGSQVVRVNESLSREAISVLFAYRKFGPGYGIGPGVIGENNRLVKALAGLAGGKLRFSEALVADTRRKHAQDLQWMEERLGASIDDYASTDAEGVDSEADLLRIASENAGPLTELIEPARRPAGPTGNDPEAVARLVHALRLQLTDAWTNRHQSTERTEMNAKQLVATIKQETPDLLAGVPEGKAARLVLAALGQIAKQIEQTEEGILPVAGMGRFRVRRGEKDTEAGKVVRTVVTFIPARKEAPGDHAAD